MLVLFSIAAFVALAIQTVIPRLLPSGMFVPDLVVILAVDLGLKHHQALAAAMAFAMGYAVDTFSGTQLGLNAFMMTLVFLFAYWLSRSLISTATVIGVIAVFFGVLAIDLGDYLIGSSFANPGRVSAMMPPMLIQAAITALLTPAVFAIMARATRMVGLRQRSLRE